MDKHYADTVRLLLNIAPDVFDNDIFAMKAAAMMAPDHLPSFLLEEIPEILVRQFSAD